MKIEVIAIASGVSDGNINPEINIIDADACGIDKSGIVSYDNFLM